MASMQAGMQRCKSRYLPPRRQSTLLLLLWPGCKSRVGAYYAPSHTVSRIVVVCDVDKSPPFALASVENENARAKSERAMHVNAKLPRPGRH